MYILLYLILINLLSFFAMFSDKRRAIGGQWRISERFLFLLAILGGSIGAILGMYLFRHKTRHWRFVWGMPAVFMLQVVLIILISSYFHA